MKWKLLALAACIGAVAILAYIIVTPGTVPAPIPLNDSTTANVSVTPSPVNQTLIIPPNEDMMEGIDWSAYPNLINPRINNVYLAKPNTVIDHDFIEVQICVSVTGTENKTILFRQLAGVAREARVVYGNNSDINIFGCHGNAAWLHVAMLPYSEKVYGFG